MLRLYFTPGTISLAPHIALEEAGADYEQVKIDFSTVQQNSEDYLALNPRARVPLLMTDEGSISETLAILLYIAQRFPEADLVPLADRFATAKVMEFCSYMGSTVHIAHAHKMRGRRWADDPEAIEDMQRKVPENMAACFEMIETQMFQGPWVMGGQFTICDPYLFAIARWLEGDKVDHSRFPKVLAHRIRMAERPSVKAVMAKGGA